VRRLTFAQLIVLLFGLGLVACLPTRGGRRGGGDDDDDSATDDDDATEPAYAEMYADPDYFKLEAGDSETAYITVTNSGEATLTASITLGSSTSPDVFALGGSSTIILGDSESTTRSLLISPASEGSYFAEVRLDHDGANSSPAYTSVYAEAYGGAVEDCSNGVDDDGDFDVDCDDSDCASDPACSGSGDPCCSDVGDVNTWNNCQDSAAVSCLCALDSYCCGTGWDSLCMDEYIGDCGATTCGP